MASRAETNEERRNRFHKKAALSKKVFVEHVTMLRDELRSIAATIALAPLYWELYDYPWCKKWIEAAYKRHYEVPDKVEWDDQIEPLVASEVASHPELQVLLEDARWYVARTWKEDDRQAAIDVSEVD